MSDNLDKIKPDELIADIAKPRMTVSFIISFVFHVAILLLLSIGFLQNCFKYKTMYPKIAIREEAKALKEKQQQEERAALMKRLEEEEKKKQEEKKNEPAKAVKPAAAAPAKSVEQQLIDKAKAEGKEVPQVLKSLTETSSERPEASTTDLDGDLK